MGKITPVSDKEMQTILTPELFSLWQTVIERIDAAYDMEKEWDKGGTTAKYCLRFRRGGKTLVTLIPKEKAIGMMFVFGRDERTKFEAKQAEFSNKTVSQYNAATTYHDGKWIKYDLPDDSVLNDLPSLLAIKRKPNKK